MDASIRILRLFAAGCCALLMWTLPANGQIHMRPQPQTTGSVYLIAELGYNLRLNPSPKTITTIQFPGEEPAVVEEVIEPLRSSFFVTSDLGLMRQIGRNWSLGATHFIGVDSGGNVRLAVRGRVRRHLGRGVSLGLSPGVYFWDSRHRPRMPAFVASVQLNVRHWLTATVLMEWIPLDAFREPATGDLQPLTLSVQQPDSDTAWYAGLRLGALPGLVANGVAALSGLIFLAISVFGGGD